MTDQLLSGDRRALARAITLVESTRDDDRVAAEKLLEDLLPHTGNAIRLGVSGTPGVGKSSFIEALGLMLVARGEKVAVLAVDPSSPTSGGSLLGDKTRMERLSKEANAFIRPSPSSGTLGGTAPHTRDAMLVCEAAGFSVVIVETVGVGQSEAAVADLVDTFLLLIHPGGGDDLQGQKRGVLELVDILVVHKSDLPNAQQTRDDYASVSALFHRELSGWNVPVLLASSKNNTGIDEVWSQARAHRQALEAAHALQSRRAEQAERAMRRALEAELVRKFVADNNASFSAALADVRSGKRSPARAARDLLR
jgi:LAO/AO transport system kinase